VTNERKKQEKQKLENILVWSCMANWVKGLPAGYKKMPFWPYTNSRL